MPLDGNANRQPDVHHIHLDDITHKQPDVYDIPLDGNPNKKPDVHDIPLDGNANRRPDIYIYIYMTYASIVARTRHHIKLLTATCT
jgi:hypothetical protein